MRIVGNNPQLSRQTQATASGAITGGKPVIVNTDGTVTQISGSAQVLSSEVLYRNNTSRVADSAFDPDNGKVVIAYREGSTGDAVVGTVSGSTISYGNTVQFESGDLNEVVIDYDTSNDKFLIVYVDAGDGDKGKAVVGTVSGTSISYGTIAVFNTSATSELDCVFDSNANRFLIVYRDAGNSAYGTAVVATISGTDVTFGDSQAANNGYAVYESNGTSRNSLCFDSTANKIVLAYNPVVSSANKGHAVVATISGAAVSFGSTAEFHSGGIAQIEIVYDSANNKTVIAYPDGQGISKVATVSGTSISFGSSVNFGGTNVYYLSGTYDPDNETVIFFYSDYADNRYGKFVTGTVSGTSISYTSATTIHSANTYYTTTVYDTTNNKIVFSFSDNGNSNKGTSIVLTTAIPTNLTSENFIGFAEDTVATGQPVTVNTKGAIDENQSSLTPAQQYFVQTDGTLGTSADDPSVVAGTAVTATKLIVKG